MQDFFETGLLPADTDFRMLSSKYGMGTLPGLDMASLLDSGAYHMHADVPERIRPGTLQVNSAACFARLERPPHAPGDTLIPSSCLCGNGRMSCTLV